MADIWTVINSITENKDDLRNDEDVNLSKLYNSYMVNKALANFTDTLLYANEMNRLYHLDYDMQYAYLLGSIKKKKRFAKWNKKDDKYLKMVSSYYGFNSKKAEEALAILSEDQLKSIKQKLDSVEGAPA